MTDTEFLATIENAARKHRLSPEGAAVHAANEANFGRSQLADKYRNLWGVKATGQHTPYWTGAKVTLPTWEEVDGKIVQVNADFRVYADWPSAVGDYADLIKRLYPYAHAHPDNPVAFLAGLFSFTRKWATDSAALSKALTILDKFYDGSVQRFGRHEVVVDNSPTVGKAVAMLSASLSRQPFVDRDGVNVTRTRRPDGSYKLDMTRAS